LGIEEKVVRADGTVIEVEVTGITIKHEGKPAFLMMYHEITTRKINEQAIRKSEERLPTKNKKVPTLFSEKFCFRVQTIKKAIDES
jgi:hypothetical protein